MFLKASAKNAARDPYTTVQLAGGLDFLTQGVRAVDTARETGWFDYIDVPVPSQFPGPRRARNAMAACDQVEGLWVLMREIRTSIKSSSWNHKLQQMDQATYRLSVVDHSPQGGAGPHGVFGAGISADDAQLVNEALDMVLWIWDARKNVFEAGGATAAYNVNRSIIDGTIPEVGIFNEMTETLQETLRRAGREGENPKIQKRLNALEVLKYKSMSSDDLNRLEVPEEVRIPFTRDHAQSIREIVKFHKLLRFVRLTRGVLGEGFESTILTLMGDLSQSTLQTSASDFADADAIRHLQSLDSDPVGDEAVSKYIATTPEQIERMMQTTYAYREML
ncbi:hypothetical protein ACFQ7B_41405 [Streptomyces erythrochromogenes]|uniref:hypothetical protein n=1 Tax=Streptomyces erythrochromogenes TaxID=285574 RepID=UPI00367B1349